VRTYRELMARYARMPLLEVWYSRVDASAIVAMARGHRRRAVARRLPRAHHHTNLDALPQASNLVGARAVRRSQPLPALRPPVVNGQRLLQTAGDIFLGWTIDGTADYYVRQLWDMKGSVDLDTLDSGDLVPYARLCGWVLARAHARRGEASAISGYLGSGDRFDQAVATFAEAYADQTESDYAAFKQVRGGSS
jgi:hypothetical protein